MDSDESLNPYAPPKAQPVSPVKAVAGLPRRPASVRWATFVFACFNAGLVVYFGQFVSAHGMQTLWQEQSIIVGLLLPFGLSFSLFGGRNKAAYYVNACVLAGIVLKLSWNTFAIKWALKGAWATVFLFDRCMEAFWLLLIWLLFYRYTFGLPSRRYFGVHVPNESSAP